MTKINQIWRCEICGNIVEVIHQGSDSLVCCGEPMKLLHEKTEDIGNEKHVPVIEKTEKGVRVKVGSTPHPMEEKHYIEFIEILTDGKTCRKFLKPGQKPEAEFEVDNFLDVKAREYCNIHGLWKNR